MRLQQFEIEAIKKTAINVFGIQSKVMLFGSRVDDSQKGGDIDLYITPGNDTEEKVSIKKITFLVKLKSLIGDQEIDVVLAKDESRLIEKEALQKGILL